MLKTMTALKKAKKELSNATKKARREAAPRKKRAAATTDDNHRAAAAATTAAAAKRASIVDDDSSSGANNDDNDLLTDEEIAARDALPAPPLPEFAEQAAFVDAARASLSDDIVGMRACAVCQRLVLKGQSSCGTVCQPFAARLTERVQNLPAYELPASIVAFYDCSDVSPHFENLLLSKKSFELNAIEQVSCCVLSLIMSTEVSCVQHRSTAIVFVVPDIMQRRRCFLMSLILGFVFIVEDR
jgi:hypothetical protein